MQDLAARAKYYASLSTLGAPEVERATPVSAAAGPAVVAPPPSAPEYPDLESIRQWIGDCQPCKLAGSRTNIVLGQGNPNACLMFVGEAPGADEDEQGLAFIGRAGQLLTDIIEKGMKMR